MRQPPVTVITPSLNQGRFIRATIESVLAQDYPAIEYIVMDGGSTDETARVVSEYSSRLTWISETDSGQSGAINKGFRRAKGEIVSWLNSDDVILPGAVTAAVAALEANPRAGAVYGEGYLIDEAGRVKGRFPATEPFNLWKLVYLWDYVLQQTVYFRRRVLEEVGYLDETLHWGMDWDLLIRIAKKYPLAYVPSFLGSLREYDAAKTFTGGAKRFAELGRLARRHTGVRFPPSYIVYGLDTYERIWSRKLAWLPAPGRRAFQAALRHWIDRTVRDAQGLYPDGWAGPRLRYMLPPGGRRILLRGTVPDLSGLRGQRLRVTVNRTLAAELTPGAGAFAAQLEAPSGAAGEPVDITVRASRSAQVAGHAGRRSFLLEELAWEEPLPEVGGREPYASAGGGAVGSRT